MSLEFRQHQRAAHFAKAAVRARRRLIERDKLLPLATLDDDPGLRPDAHAFIVDKAP